MRDLQSVLRTVRDHVTGFPTVRVTAVQTQEQLLREIQAISPNSLPGVLIVYDRWSMSESGTIRDVQLTLVVVDRFRAAAEDKAFSAFAAFDRLAALFPADGTDLGGAFALPVDSAAAGLDADLVCIALGVQVRTGG